MNYLSPPYLIKPVSRLGEWHRDAGAQVAASSVTVRKAGYHPFSFQRRQAHLNHLTKKKHSLRQRVAETEREEGNCDNLALEYLAGQSCTCSFMQLKSAPG